MICTLRSENIYLFFVFVVFDRVYVFVLFFELRRITFQFVAIVGAEGQVHISSKEDEPGPTNEMIKHSTSTPLLKTLGRRVDLHHRC